MSKELTYILGAGASFQSIPTVKTFNNRLIRFQKFLSDESQKEMGDIRIKFIAAVNSLKSIHKDFSSHQSFDTYFKKLFHLGLQDKINFGKKLLNLYFLWEHSSASLHYNLFPDDPYYEESFKKESLFDKRYDALVAGLIRPISGKSEPICHINFVTWNYDINLLISLKNFFYPNLSFDEFFKRINYDQFVWKINDQIRIVNINGYFYSSNFRTVSNLENINVANIIREKIINDYLGNDVADEDASRIRFAWELNEQDESNLKISLTEMLNKSDHIVIIGYTFPIYNRFIDLGFLKQDFVSNKDIIIQDPDADNLKQHLHDIYRVNEKSKTRIISNCNSFYLPSSIFGIEEFDNLSWVAF